jgi:type I restriction enzyme, R subunit
MTNRLYESEIEQIVLDILREENGYATAFGPEITKGADPRVCPNPEREHTEVVLQGRLRAAIDRLNPAIPAEAREDAARKALRTLR